MKKMRVLIIISSIALFSFSAKTQTGNISTSEKFAWSANTGWINFCPTHGGVTVYTDHLEGYAWAENVGWIRMGSHEGGGAFTYENSSNTNYGVNNDGAGNLSGYAWGTNIGWINFNPADSQVTIDPSSGSFDGYAWAENIGWIHFKNVSPDYNVVTTHVPISVKLSSFTATMDDKYITLTWVTESEANLAGFNIYRKCTPTGSYEKLNETLILAEGNPTVGKAYSFNDSPGLDGNYFYKLDFVSLDGAVAQSFETNQTVSMVSNKTTLEKSFKLYQNYPNPFNPETTISYNIPDNELVNIMIMNINGEQVAELVNGIQSSGMHFVKWNGTDSNNTKVANGIYFYKMTAGKFIEIKRLVLLN